LPTTNYNTLREEEGGRVLPIAHLKIYWDKVSRTQKKKAKVSRTQKKKAKVSGTRATTTKASRTLIYQSQPYPFPIRKVSRTRFPKTRTHFHSHQIS
jgi:hypothetical protein